MNETDRDNEGRLRIATPEDIPILLNHHRKMFEEIREKTGNPVDLPILAALENAEEKMRDRNTGKIISAGSF